MKRLAAILLFKIIIAGFVVGIVFINPHDKSISPLVPWGAFAVSGICICILYLMYKSKNQQPSTANRALIDQLKRTGEKIPVDLRSCEVKSNSWTETVNPNDQMSDTELMLSSLGGIAARDSETKEVDEYRSVIIFHKGSERFCSPILNRDEDTLKMLIDIHEKTFIYRDRADRKKFYFDLEFLEN